MIPADWTKSEFVCELWAKHLSKIVRCPIKKSPLSLISDLVEVLITVYFYYIKRDHFHCLCLLTWLDQVYRAQAYFGHLKGYYVFFYRVLTKSNQYKSSPYFLTLPISLCTIHHHRKSTHPSCYVRTQRYQAVV